MNKYKKVIFILLLAVTMFHVSGVEAAFCDESLVTQQTQSHGCMVCQPGHHAVTILPADFSYLEAPITFFSSKVFVLRLQEPARFILRPPITL